MDVALFIQPLDYAWDMGDSAVKLVTVTQFPVLS